MGVVRGGKGGGCVERRGASLLYMNISKKGISYSTCATHFDTSLLIGSCSHMGTGAAVVWQVDERVRRADGVWMSWGHGWHEGMR